MPIAPCGDSQTLAPPKLHAIDFSQFSPKMAAKLRADFAEADAERDPAGMDSEELSDMNRMLRGESE